MSRKLVVIAPPGSMMPHYDRMALNPPIRAFLPAGEPVTVEFRREWLKEIKAGCLAPGDAETARLAGVPVPELVKKKVAA